MTTHSLPVRRRFAVGRMMLLSIAAALFAIGWFAGVAVRAAVWTATAVAVGFRDARGTG